MDTIVRPPEAPPDQPVGTGTSRRRWPRRVAVALAVLLAIALVAGLSWVANVEPLTRGNSGFPVRDPRVESSSRYVDGFGQSGLVNTVRVDPGTTFRYEVTISNDGPLPVTIESIGAGGDGPISRRAVAYTANPYAGGNPRTTTPFAPFRLDPNQGAFIVMEVRVGTDACLERDTQTAWLSEAVTYRILGITRHSDVQTGIDMRIEGKDGPTTGCS